MRNSARYARKVKKLLAGARKAEAPHPVDKLRLLVRAVLEEDAAGKLADEAVAALEEEYVDLNELRVSPTKDIVECLGRDFPKARSKAEALPLALNGVFDRANTLSLEYLVKKPKREIRKALREELGLSPYAESVLTLYGFDGHAIPVDELLLEALKLGGYIHPDSDAPDLQGFLERIILSKDAMAAHEALRAYASRLARKVAKELARRAEQARAEAEAQAKAAAEAQAAAEAKAAAEALAAAGEAAEAAAAQAGRKKARKAAAKKPATPAVAEKAPAKRARAAARTPKATPARAKK